MGLDSSGSRIPANSAPGRFGRFQVTLNEESVETSTADIVLILVTHHLRIKAQTSTTVTRQSVSWLSPHPLDSVAIAFSPQTAVSASPLSSSAPCR